MGEAGAIKMLLLEDNETDALLLRMSLTASGKFDLLHTERLHDALQILDSEVFDLIVTDLDLPNGTGMRIVQKLAQHARGTPIVVLTGSDDADIKEQVTKEHASASFSKTLLTSSELETALCEIAAHRHVS